MTQMFYGCNSLQTVLLFDTSSVTSMSYMFRDCSSLQTVPLFDTASATSMSNMFNGCTSLQTVPLFDTSSVTNMSIMFYNCTSLQTVPLFDTSSATSMSSMFNYCNSLQNLPALNATSVTSAPALSLSSLTTIGILNMKATWTIANCQLSATALNNVFTNLGIASTKTLTITNNYGSAPVSKTSSGTTSGSTTVTLANTSSLATGMEVTGTGLTDTRAVTFTDAGDLVNLTAHGIPNDKIVSLQTIVSTTGIVIKTAYFVVGATANTFQLSLTEGGAAINLVTNGSGTLLVVPTITAISDNVNFTMDVPATATGSTTTISTVCLRSRALLKGWTVVA